MSYKSQLRQFAELGWLATAQISAYQSAGEKSCAFVALRTCKCFHSPCNGPKGSAAAHTERLAYPAHPVHCRRMELRGEGLH